jgi:glycosyltransferase involved in cell wall biosynthesis
MSEFTVDRTNVAALIPGYFEERLIREVVERVRQQLDRVLVVDDGSTDATEAQAKAGGAEVVRHEVNQGKGAAIKTGLRYWSERPEVRAVIILDGDGQHAPEEIPRFLEEASKGTSAMLVGNRMADVRTMPKVRQLTNRFMSWQISRICGQAIPDTQCGFRLFRSELFAQLLAAPAQRYDYETEMLVITARLGHHIGAVPVSTIYGEEKSKIHPVRDTIRFYQLLHRLRQKAK